MGLERLDTTGVTGQYNQAAQIAGQRRLERAQKKAAMLSTMGALGGFAIGGPLGASIGGAAGGALAGRPPNVPALVQTGIAMQDRNQQQEQIGTLQSALTPQSQDDLGLEGTATTSPQIDRGEVISALSPINPGMAVQMALQGQGGGGPRKTLKDVAGFNRFVDNGVRVFPGVDRPEGTSPQGRRPSNYLLPNKQTILSHDDRTYVDPDGKTQAIPPTAIRLGPDVAAKEARGARQGVAARGGGTAQQSVGGPASSQAGPSAAVNARDMVRAAEEGGIGPWSNMAAAADAVVGGLGAQQAFGIKGSIFSKTQQNRQYLRTVKQIGKAVFVNNPRFPVAEQKLVDKLLPDPDRFWANPSTTANNIVTLRSVLGGWKASNDQAISGGLLSPTQQDNLVMKNIEIKRMLSFMGGTPDASRVKTPLDDEARGEKPDALSLMNLDTSKMNAVELKAHNDALEQALGLKK